MRKNYISLAGDLQIIKKTMTPTEFKGYLKGRVLELRLACAEPDIVVSELQAMITVYSEELNAMTAEKKQADDCYFQDASKDEHVESEDESEEEAGNF